MKPKTLLRPQNLLFVYLAALLLVAVACAQNVSFFFMVLLVLAGVSLGYLFPWGIQRLRKQVSRMRPENAGITILILTLLVDPRIGFFWAIGLGLVTAFVKMRLRFQGKPVLNPAAAGLAIFSLFGIFDSWWGVSFAPRFSELFISIAVVLTIPFAGYVAYRYRKLWIPLALGIAFALGSFVLSGSVPWIILLEGTVFFFALVMASEPLTSPVVRKEQIVFGASVGLLLALFLDQAWPLTYCGPLLLVNAAYVLYRRYTQRRLLQKARLAEAARQNPAVPSK